MKFDFVYLGQTVLKYQVPLEVFVGLNEIYERQKETITPGTTQPEVFNILGQLEALKKGLKEKTLSLDSKKTKKLK